MSKLRFVTDSTADIPQEIRESLGIEMVPLKVHFGSETYLDAITLQSDEFYPKLAAAQALPTTSQPSPIDFVDVYKRILDSDPEVHIISIHLSAAFSGTYQSAELARSLLEQQDRITIVDSRWASYGIGMLVIAAVQAAKEGKSKQEVLDLIQSMRAESKLYFIVDTLEYLQKGGRIGKASAMLGSLLNIKPILTIDDEGEIDSVDKVRGSKRAIQRILELLKQDFGPEQEVNIAILHAYDPEAAEELNQVLREQFNVKESAYAQIGPVIGTHTGPGTVGVFMGPVLK